MSKEHCNTVKWTCDLCGCTAMTVIDYRPSNWHSVADRTCASVAFKECDVCGACKAAFIAWVKQRKSLRV